jgi:hypothetical protein
MKRALGPADPYETIEVILVENLQAAADWLAQNCLPRSVGTERSSGPV